MYTLRVRGIRLFELCIFNLGTQNRGLTQGVAAVFNSVRLASPKLALSGTKIFNLDGNGPWRPAWWIHS